MIASMSSKYGAHAAIANMSLLRMDVEMETSYLAEKIKLVTQGGPMRK
jgi:hypothetical protein